MTTNENELTVTVPYSQGFEMFKPNVLYHFAVNVGDMEDWSFWKLTKIVPYEDPTEESGHEIAYYFIKDGV